MKARIRFTRPNSLDGENVVVTITDMEKHKVEVTIPIKSLMHAIMGVAGVDCEMETNMTDLKNKMTAFNDPNLDEILCGDSIEPNRIKERVNKMKNYTATEMWCRITNALISKYKEMSEEDPKGAVEDLLRLEGALLVGGFLTKEELEKGL